MKNATLTLLGLLGALAAGVPGFSQEPRLVPTSPAPAVIYPDGPPSGAPCVPSKCFGWTRACFPRCGCPDDYCPTPLPRQCWEPYPPFYRCVPAGDCDPGCNGRRIDRLTWWFIPTPRAL